MPRGRAPKNEKPQDTAETNTQTEVEERESATEDTKKDTTSVEQKKVALETDDKSVKEEEKSTLKENKETSTKEEVIKNYDKTTNDTTAGGWGETTTTEGGWGTSVEAEKKPQTEATSNGWGENETVNTLNNQTKETSNGWGEPTVDKADASTTSWSAPAPSVEQQAPPCKQGGYESQPREYEQQSYQRSSHSTYSEREPRRNESYGPPRNYAPEPRGRSYDRPPRDAYPREPRQYKRYPPLSGGPSRHPSYRDEPYPPRDGDYPRKRYDQPDYYSRDDKRPRYDDRQPYPSSRPQDDYHNKGRPESQYPPARDDRYNRPPHDDYDRGRERTYDRNSGYDYESRGDNDRPYEPRVPRERKPFPSNVSPSKAIGIFGLSIHATENDLREFLADELTNISDYKITIVHDRNTGMSKGYGFVYFQSLEDSISAKERLAGKSIKGKEIRVDFSISDALRPSYR